MIGTLLKPATPPMLEKLRVAAQNYPCVLCGRNKMFTVGAHSNSHAHGRGFAHKAHSYYVAYVCNYPGGCHDRLDGRSGGLTKEEKRAMWNEAYALTVGLWFSEGLIRIV